MVIMRKNPERIAKIIKTQKLKKKHRRSKLRKQWLELIEEKTLEMKRKIHMEEVS